jgi:hypothetical protein
MKPPSSKLQQQQKEEIVETRELRQQAVARGFGTVEEMLRFDARQNPVPESVRTRLTESVQKEPKPGAWWKRWLT